MSKPNELREQAWRLVYAAKHTANLKRRRMLMKEAYELSERAARLLKWQSAEPNEAMRAIGRSRTSSGATAWLRKELAAKLPTTSP